MEVETLIQQMQDTLADIRAAVNQASGKSQNDELDRLEQTRDSQLAELKSAFEKEKQDLEAKRRAELEDVQKKRKQEDEEREARRRREDEELAKAKSNEDKQRKKQHDKEANSIEDETGQKMDEIEDMTQKMAQEGVQKMKSLVERRNDLNRLIDEQLNQPLPTPSPRRRDKTKKESREKPKKELEEKPSKESEGKSKKEPEEKSNKEQEEKHKKESEDKPKKESEEKPKKEAKNKPKQEANGKPPNGMDGDSSPIHSPETNDSNSKASTKPPDNNTNNTHSKDRQSSNPSSPTKSSSEVKKDGELPFQGGSRGLPQAAEESAENLMPQSLAEVLKNNVSNNGSKAKPKPERDSSNLRGARSSKVAMADKTAAERGSGTTAHTEMQNIQGGKVTTANTKLTLDARTRPEEAGNDGIETFSTEKRHGIDQTQLDRDPACGPEREIQPGTIPNQFDQANTEKGSIDSQSKPKPHSEHGSVSTKVGEPDPETHTQRSSDQHHTPNIDTLKTGKPSKDPYDGRTSDISERPPATSQPPFDVAGTEAHTVGSESAATHPPQLPPPPPSDKEHARQDREAHDRVGREQRTSPHPPDEGRAGGDREESFGALRWSQPVADKRLAVVEGPLEAPSRAPLAPLRGDLGLSLDGDMFDFSPDFGPSVHLGSAEYLPALPERKHMILGKKSASPLPVENETVRGQDRLFDDNNKSASDRSETHTSDDDDFHLSPPTPVEGHDLPVLLEPTPHQSVRDEGLTKLMDSVDNQNNWTTVAGQLNAKTNMQSSSGSWNARSDK